MEDKVIGKMYCFSKKRRVKDDMSDEFSERHDSVGKNRTGDR